jgi:hypothetical protein
MSVNVRPSPLFLQTDIFLFSRKQRGRCPKYFEILQAVDSWVFTAGLAGYCLAKMAHRSLHSGSDLRVDPRILAVGPSRVPQ